MNNCPLRDGFRAKEVIKDPNTIPIPAPTPAREIVAQPAPIIFAACKVTFIWFVWFGFVKKFKMSFEYKKRKTILWIWYNIISQDIYFMLRFVP